MKKTLLSLILASAAFATGASGVTITKAPDLGSYWQPLQPNGGTYVYANSFVATETGVVTNLGAWLNALNVDATTEVVYHVLGSIGGLISSGPDMANILATSSAVSNVSSGLALYDASILSSAQLTSGSTYWFAASVLGSTGNGVFQVGGHTRNSGGIIDNGSFWFSNDASGIYFDGRSYVPEMAFTVTIEAGNGQQVPPSHNVPDAGSSLAMLAVGVGAIGLLKRRR